jgi:hypothetical protein
MKPNEFDMNVLTHQIPEMPEVQKAPDTLIAKNGNENSSKT